MRVSTAEVVLGQDCRLSWQLPRSQEAPVPCHHGHWQQQKREADFLRQMASRWWWQWESSHDHPHLASTQILKLWPRNTHSRYLPGPMLPTLAKGYLPVLGCNPGPSVPKQKQVPKHQEEWAAPWDTKSTILSPWSLRPCYSFCLT